MPETPCRHTVFRASRARPQPPKAVVGRGVNAAAICMPVCAQGLHSAHTQAHKYAPTSQAVVGRWAFHHPTTSPWGLSPRVTSPKPPAAMSPDVVQKSTLRHKCLPLSAAIMAFMEATLHHFCTACGDIAPPRGPVQAPLQGARAPAHRLRAGYALVGVRSKRPLGARATVFHDRALGGLAPALRAPPAPRAPHPPLARFPAPIRRTNESRPLGRDNLRAVARRRHRRAATPPVINHPVRRASSSGCGVSVFARVCARWLRHRSHPLRWHHLLPGALAVASRIGR